MPHISRRYSVIGWSAATVACLALSGPAYADDSKMLLKAMSDYLASQQQISFDYQSSVEVVTPEFEKLQFVSSGTAVINRPDKARITRKGGIADIDISLDGKALTVHGKRLDAYAKIDVKGTLDDVFNELNAEGVGLPGSDLFVSDAYGLLTVDSVESKHVAGAVVGGVECEYLTFRTPEVDWQIWIESGARPIPLRYVVTTKHVAQAPQYTLQISNFKTGAEAAKPGFTIEIPKDAKPVDLSDIEHMDELPQPSGGDVKKQ